MRTVKVRSLLFVLLLTAACLAQDTSIIVNDNKVHRQIPLTHASLLAVNGNGNTLTVSGDCPSVLLRGDRNHVVFAGAIDSVTISGTDNVLEFDGPLQDLEVTGISNQVLTKRGPSGKALHLEITGDGNLVRWARGGHKDAPDTHDLGDKNKILQVP
ncbi:MAG: DUF3060 domain-containing protein [Candidatus Xenobia bacterium]